jgi:hypothetical protein
VEPFQKVILKYPDFLKDICQAAPATDTENYIMQSVFAVAFHAGLLGTLITALISEDVKASETESTLFRMNSPATRMMTVLSRLSGMVYLRSLLEPVISELVKDDVYLEIDRSRAPKGTDIENNIVLLRYWCLTIIDKILRFVTPFPFSAAESPTFAHLISSVLCLLRSVDVIPMPIRLICAVVKQEVASRFPDAVTKSLGGYLFLRFICPALASPDKSGIIQGPIPMKVQRSLVLLTKVRGSKSYFRVPTSAALHDG